MEILYFISAIGILFALVQLLHLRYGKVVSFCILLGFAVFLMIFNFFLFHTFFTIYLILPEVFYALYFLIPVIILFKNNLQHKLFLYFLCMINVSFSLILSEFFSGILPIGQANMKIYLICALYTIIFGAISSSFPIMLKNNFRQFMRIGNKSFWNGMCTMIIMAYILVKLLVPHFQHKGHMIYSQSFLLSILIFLLIYSIMGLMFYSFLQVSEKTKYRDISKEIAKEVGMQVKYYEQLTANMENIRKIKHDINKHFLTISGFLANKDYAHLEEYVKQVTMQNKQNELTCFCENSTVNAIIASYFSIATENHIEFEHSIKIGELVIASVDIGILFGNLLENAVEACKKLPPDVPRYIKTDAGVVNSMLAIRMVNSYDGVVNKVKDQYYTTKSGQGHGLGLFNVQEIVKRYDGNVVMSHTEYEFNAAILLNNRILAEK